MTADPTPTPPAPAGDEAPSSGAAASPANGEALETPRAHPNRWGEIGLAIGALGVVYGDIGTSPLYAFKECLLHGVAPVRENVLGLLSLFVWSLTLVVVVKYIIFVMRADNQGEGGILALLALVTPRDKPERKTWPRALIVGLGLFGAALLFADGMITPAITVLSAIEGLEVATHKLELFVAPITALILIIVFLFQKRGTAGIASVFGPAMLVWFISITMAGIPWIFTEPSVLYAIAPWHAVRFFVHHGVQGFLVLGAVVLCITGAEALYADMGHFGRKPIRRAWFAVAFPALLVNYFGQGAMVLHNPPTINSHGTPFNPFYSLVSGPAMYPMLIIATIASVIASQALISGAFSLAQQAVQLGYSPRLTIRHTSSETRGQIYVPEINSILMVACVALVLTFRKSTNLAAAYGIAVMGTMTITSLLLFAVMRRRWGWSLARAGGLTALFLAIDLTFLLSNITKIRHGGWFPLVVAGAMFVILATWKTGRARLSQTLRESTLPFDKFLSSLDREMPTRVPGTAVFMTSNPDGTPIVLMHHFKHNKVLHERTVLLCVVSEEVPEVPAEARVTVRDRGRGFYQVVAHYGFMQTPSISEIFRACGKKNLKLHPREASFYLGRETLIITARPGMARWRKSLFAVLSRNARSATAYFDIPPNRVVELGAQIEL